VKEPRKVLLFRAKKLFFGIGCTHRKKRLERPVRSPRSLVDIGYRSRLNGVAIARQWLLGIAFRSAP